jgi:hypothetical protein
MSSVVGASKDTISLVVDEMGKLDKDCILYQRQLMLLGIDAASPTAEDTYLAFLAKMGFTLASGLPTTRILLEKILSERNISLRSAAADAYITELYKQHVPSEQHATYLHKLLAVGVDPKMSGAADAFQKRLVVLGMTAADVTADMLHEFHMKSKGIKPGTPAWQDARMAIYDEVPLWDSHKTGTVRRLGSGHTEFLRIDVDVESGGRASILTLDEVSQAASFPITGPAGSSVAGAGTGAVTGIVTTQFIDKMSYRTVETIIRKIYNDISTTRSTALDILAVYLKGQKTLYTEAKTLCEMRLHTLMLPAILVSAICTVLSIQLKDYENGAIIVSSLNAFNSFLLALVSYLKLDAKAEAHKTSAYKYDKLQSYCEFNSGKVMFFNDDKTKINEIIERIETQVSEIKETNQFIIPESIRYNYKELYGTNVFAMVKVIQNKEMTHINDLKGVINRLIDLNNRPAGPDTQRVILEAEKEQNSLINAIIKLRNEYADIDKKFDTEIKEQIRSAKRSVGCLYWLKT